MDSETSRSGSRWPVLVTLGLLLVVVVVFVIEFIAASQSPALEDSELTAETYMDEVGPLLANGRAENGPDLVVKYGCDVCHIMGVENGIAPSWDGLSEHASERRQPLVAPAYIYESIAYPGAFLVEDFPDSMPRGYLDRISEADFGDLLAYLLQQ